MNTRQFLVLASISLMLNACSSSDKTTQTAADVQEEQTLTVEDYAPEPKIVVKKVERKASEDAGVLNVQKEESVFLLDAKSAAEIDALLSKRADVNYHDAEGRTALMLAAKRDDIEAARRLIAAGALVNALDGSSRNALFYAKSAKMAKLLLDNGADIHQTSNSGSTVLHNAKLSAEMERLYLKRGADLFEENALGLTPIHTLKSPESIKFLLEAGANPNQRGGWDTTPLSEAHADDAVRMLLEAGADPLAVSNSRSIQGFPNHILGGSVLHSEKDGKAVARLLKAGVDPNATDKQGITPIFVVQDAEGANALIQAGADVNAVSEKGWVPLMTARKADVVKALLDAGADATYTLRRFSNASTLYVYKPSLGQLRKNQREGKSEGFEKETDAVKALLNAGADVNAAAASRNRAPIHVYENEATFEALLAANADIHRLDDDGRSALHHQTNPANVRALINAGADVNARDIYGKTPIFYQNNRESLKLLIDAGADVNAVIPQAVPGFITDYGNNALFFQSDPECIRLLVKAGADVNAQNHARNTPLHAAKSLPAILMLLELGANPKTKNDKNKTPFDTFAPSSEAEYNTVLAMFLKKGMDPNALTPNGNPILFSAIDHHSATAVDLLLKAGADPNAKSESGSRGPTSLLSALGNRVTAPESTQTLETLQLLLKAGADPDRADPKGQTPLMYAKSAEAVDLLLKAGANINAVDQNGDNALVHYKQSDAVDLLLDKGIKIDNIVGYAPAPVPKDRRHARKVMDPERTDIFDVYDIPRHTHYSASNIQRMIKRGVDLKQKNAAGETLLMRAIDEDGVKCLLDAGADGNAVTADNHSVRYKLMHRGGFYGNAALSPEIQLRLPPTPEEEKEPQTADIPQESAPTPPSGSPSPRTPKGLSPLLASQLTAEEVKSLVKAGADPNAHTRKHGYALHYQKDPATKRALLKAGARVDTRKLPPEVEPPRRSPEDIACPVMATSLICAPTLEDAKMFVEAGADVNAQTNQQITPLMNHAALGHCDIVRYLLQKGADPWLQSSSYQTAYDLAASAECRAILRKSMTK